MRERERERGRKREKERVSRYTQIRTGKSGEKKESILLITRQILPLPNTCSHRHLGMGIA